MEWDLTNDKSRISEVMITAAAEGPQTIVNGEQRYTLTADAKPPPPRPGAPKTFKEWILNGPSLEGVDLERDRTPDRDIEF
jgi:hypothetical protein